MTHVFFDSDSIDWAPYFARQMVGQGQIMQGRGPPDEMIAPIKVFRGMRYVKGYGSVRNMFGSLGRFLMPIASNIASAAKQEALGTLGHVTSDVLAGKPLPETLRERGQEGVKAFRQRLEQCGKGRRKKGTTVGIDTMRNAGVPIKKGRIPKNTDILRDIATREISYNQKPRRKTRDYLDFN